MATKPSADNAPAPSGKPSSRLSKEQKFALLGGVLVLIAVLGFYLFAGSSGDDAKAFTNYLYSNNQSGMLMDLRGSPSANVSQKILQCGVNLIQSGFYARTGKDLAVFACDNNGCLASNPGNATANASAPVANLTYSDVLYALRGRAYFDILYGAQQHDVFHPTYAEVYLNADSDPAACSLGVQTSSGNVPAPVAGADSGAVLPSNGTAPAGIGTTNSS